MLVDRHAEQLILHPAMTAFAEHSGMTMRRVLEPPVDYEIGSRQVDDFVQIKAGSITETLCVEIKGEVRKAGVEQLLGAMLPRQQWLLVAKYIPAPLKEFLRHQGCNYLEASGNCYINTGQLVIFINDQEVKQVRQSNTGKIWKSAGLQYLFVVLQDPAMLQRPYRVIAKAAGISAGNIADLRKELQASDYITHEGIFSARDKLIERWVEMYALTLKPKVFKGRFRFASKQFENNWRGLTTDGMYWGGEPGADIYTFNLLPQEFTLYTSFTGNELVSKLRIVPDEDGPITVLDKFWHDWEGDRHNRGAAPPLIVYADLRNSLDSRNWEIANRIKNSYLHE
ncbi:type IV toxin-antitoxin system AbiEi family antitoxin [Chitinophaga parva]|nr:type IV toxin-antitoxin system AbiEi family antitoxin [Chitinophaga parva]